MTTSENEYYTAHDVNTYDDCSDLMYHTAYVEEKDGANDDTISAGEIPEESETSSNSISSAEEDDVSMTTPNNVIAPSSWIRYRIPDKDLKRNEEAIVENKDAKSLSAEEQKIIDSITYATQTSPRCPNYEDTVYCYTKTNDVGVVTDDAMKKNFNEIMINFPPYFEMQRRHVIVATATGEDIYAVPDNRRKRKSVGTYTNGAFEESESDPMKKNTEIQTYPRRHAQKTEAATSSKMVPQQYSKGHYGSAQTGLGNSSSTLNEKSRNEIGTQTHLSLSRDIVRVINEMGDISKIRTWSSSEGIAGAALDHSENYVPRNVEVYSRSQPLPAEHTEIALVQSSDLESAKPRRYESYASSSRFSHKGTERVYPKAFRRSVISRASTIISEQLSKVVITAKKYKTEIIVLCVLILLLIGGITAMIFDFTSI